MKKTESSELKFWEIKYNNNVFFSKWAQGVCYIVHSRNRDDSTMIEMSYWLSDHSTDEWSKFYKGVYAFRSEKDAMRFKLVWG